ncbi:MAG: ROK family protein [Flavobacteriales bacterium]|nr:ROK family protein [Flavobacteriales bacterium]
MAVLGLDLGGTKLKGGIFTESSQIVYKDECKLEHRTGEDVGKLIQDFVSRTLKHATTFSEKIEAIGICVPGISYQEEGTVWCPNIPGWDNYPLKARIESVCPPDVKVTVDSDRVCCILGEAWTGAAKDINNAIFLAVGTGIAAGILANGRVLRGAHDISGAIGWWALDKEYKQKYEPCGCFEHHCSGEGLAKVAREQLVENPNYNGPLRHKRPEDVTSYDLFELYPQGDEIATKTFDIAIEMWAMAVANLVSLFDPSRVIFGGGVFGPAMQFLPRIREAAIRHAQPISIRKVEIVPSELGSDAVLIGAGYLALRSITD